MRSNKRRRIFYIDKIFQKKLMLLLLGLNLGIVIANILFYGTYLKAEVERNLYRSHIELSNINEIMAGDVLKFNLLLAVVSICLVVLFYTVVRLRLKRFFHIIKQALEARRAGAETEPETLKFPEKFYEIDRVLQDFFQYTDSRAVADDRRIKALKTLTAEVEG